MKRSSAKFLRIWKFEDQIMKTLNEIKQLLQIQKPYIADAYGIREIGIFGSYVRNEAHPDSDLDLLIEPEYPPRMGLIGLGRLERYLGELLGIKVNIAIKKNLRPRISRQILSEVIAL